MARRAPGLAGISAPNTIFRRLLYFSILLHLSMVTVFEVVVYLPARQIQFYDFEVVEYEQPEAAATAPQSGDLRLGGAPTLPDIALPTLEFSALERLRIRQEGVDDPGLYAKLYPDAQGDPWQRLTSSLDRARLSLSRTFSGTPTEANPAIPIHRPADGFEAYLEWEYGAEPRALLFAPPIQALWELPPERLERPIELILKITPEGRVVSVWSPGSGDSELLDAIQLSVLKYRFGPLLDSQDQETGALRIPNTGDNAVSASLFIRSARDAR